MWPKHNMAFFFLDFIFPLFPKHSPDQSEKTNHFLVSESRFQRVLIKRVNSSKPSTSHAGAQQNQCRNSVGEEATQQLLKFPTELNNSRQHVQLL